MGHIRREKVLGERKSEERESHTPGTAPAGALPTLNSTTTTELNSNTRDSASGDHAATYQGIYKTY
jgi:hypothetical protein